MLLAMFVLHQKHHSSTKWWQLNEKQVLLHLSQQPATTESCSPITATRRWSPTTTEGDWLWYRLIVAFPVTAPALQLGTSFYFCLCRWTNMMLFLLKQNSPLFSKEFFLSHGVTSCPASGTAG